MFPVERLSKHVTKHPFFNKNSHKLEPIKPAPPVTNIFKPINSSYLIIVFLLQIFDQKSL